MQGITGRDDYIIAKALYWALKHSSNLPGLMHETSDEDDMRKIALTRYGRLVKGFKSEDENALANIEEFGSRFEDHARVIKALTPPNLDADAEFIEDGLAPTPAPDFITEDDALARTAANLTSGRISGAIDPK